MHDQQEHDRVVAVSDLRDYFRNSIDTAIDKQGVDVDSHAAHYVVNLLTLFSRSDELYEENGDVSGLRPLTLMMAAASDAKSAADRKLFRPRIGVGALFI